MLHNEGKFDLDVFQRLIGEALPTIADSCYSPDFMYVVKKSNGEQVLNIVVETKAVENETVLRSNERIKIACAERFFEQLEIDGYTVHFLKQLNNKAMKTIINEVQSKS